MCALPTYLLCLSTAFLFRFGFVVTGFASMGLALLAAAITGWKWESVRLRHAGVLFVNAGVLAVFGLHPNWWPCEVSCQEGVDYRTLFGAPILWLAVPAYLVAALWLFLGSQRSPTSQILAWALIGSSAYYVWLSINLGMTCGHCLSVHTAVLASILGLMRASLPWTTRGVFLFLPFLTLHLLYVWDLRRAITPPAPPAPSPTELETPTVDVELLPDGRRMDEAADAGRRFGSGNNVLRVELVVGFNCGHCAQEFEKILDRLAPFLGDGKAELIVRHRYARKETGSVELVRHALSAAALGMYREFAVRAFAMKRSTTKTSDGRPAGIDPKLMAEMYEQARNPDGSTLKRLKEEWDLTEEAAMAIHYQTALDRVMQADDARVEELQALGELPQVILVNPSNGEILQRLEEEASASVIAAAVRQRLGL